MILLWLLIILLCGGLLAWLVGHRRPLWARWIALAALAIDLLLSLGLWFQQAAPAPLSTPQPWLAELRWSWMPQLGISLHLAMDGLSVLLVLLTCFLGLVAVAASWSEIQERVGLFHANVLWVLAGVMGVFLSLDLFVFYVCWEVMLVPMYFLISLWGHENRLYAAMKFFLFTQASGLLMLTAILALVFLHAQHTGVYTFSYPQLLGTPMASSTAMWLLLGFFVAFAVKLPVLPVHTWLPDAHTEAPTAGSVILAGLLLKTGGYGLLRFLLPLFPEAAQTLAPVAMLLGVLGILYGAMLALAQTDVKRLVAYTSVSHMGFVVLGIFAGTTWALQGAVLEIICHGLSTGGLFLVAGVLQERLHTRDIRRMGGLWATMPRLGGVSTVLAVASLGLPGLGNFVAEFLVLVGAFQVSPVLTIMATLGLVLAVVYALRLVQYAFHGPNVRGWQLPDLGRREMAVMLLLIASLLWLGLFPQAVLDTAAPVLHGLQRVAEQSPLTRR